MGLSRRQFFTLAGTSVVTTVMATHLRALYAQDAQHLLLSPVGYGPLQPDPNGLLDLPAGFRYRVFSREGEMMSDGQRVPGAHDGMAAFAGDAGQVVLTRNHELSPGDASRVMAPTEQRYDPQGQGGTTTLVLTPDRQLVSHYGSLAGTCRNCAGGPTPWGTWISCEEDTSTPATHPSGSRQPVTVAHGYNFEVPVTATAPVVPEPLRAMGRFRHEAIAVDPRTGIVYQTEDQGDGLFYRFIPHQPGRLSQGGRLEALRIQQRPGAITRINFPVGVPLAVDWVPLEDIDPAADTLRLEGFSKGAAQFSRGEGICYNRGQIFFTCTNGGNAPHGQIWRYLPSATAAGGTLELFVQPDNPRLLDLPDNLVMGPMGDLLVCEDGAGEQFIVGVTAAGQLYRLARNALNGAEFAGICVSPDGQTLFVNLYSPGMTFAIWPERGNWQHTA